MGHARSARAGHAGRWIGIGRRWFIAYLAMLQACDGEISQLRARFPASLGLIDRDFQGLQNVTTEMNETLCKDFTDEEIGDALFQIGPLKAPGVDGFPARFYQRNWGTLKEEVINAVKLFFVTGQMPPGVNESAIVLIPKVDQPETLKDFRPISLCTVIYKIIAKCMVNRLRPMLGEIVSINQSAFVPGRLITDNALVAFECLHFIEQNTNQSKNYCAYKLDLSKAYDRVDWDFLRKVMQRMGFSHRWVDWVDQATKVKEVLDLYASSTGQLINPSKCSIMLGDSCPMEIRTEIKNNLQVTQEAFETKYLGLPTPDGRNGSKTWHAIEYGLELLKQGVIWRVGNGAQIRAWRDPWIPRDSNHHPRRGMAKTSFCQICGQEEEDTFHIFVRCPHARALWMAMKEEWTLPDDDLIKPTGKEWTLPDAGNPNCKSKGGWSNMEKGKMVITHEAGFRKEDRRSDGSRKVKKTWTPPGEGRLKLNVDGAFSSSGGARAGMLLRDHQGIVVAAACRALVQCRNPTEAELLAIEEGLRLALMWSPLPFTVETDSSEAAELIKGTTPNISIYAFTISAIREMLQERDISVIKISRDANRASHELAKIGRVDQRNAIWFVDLPLVVSQAIELDCNPVAI
ncbi:hypothetical protein QYE76_048417 [Lolium multiflorum]|uniref:Retrotransposon protein, putative, unclassified n=1 Tax=Lolium multiflorum TaxID=4521 RepID=A0AAD8SN28_LOLMU|nr:hypothetical protein QYE76_048417 [Lolium multiflorum]